MYGTMSKNPVPLFKETETLVEYALFITALAGVLPIIQVQSTSDLTTAVIRFSLSTLQTDIVGVANGTASEELITSYTSDILNYIAQDQNVDSNDITPDITSIADTATVEEDGSVTINVLANDSFITTAPTALLSLIHI